MAKKKKAAKKTKKPAKKAVKKVLKKKSTGKKISKKKTLKKKTAKKKTAKRKTRGSIKKKVASPKSRASATRSIPAAAAGSTPAKEPTQEQAIGTVTHFYSHLNVAVVQMNAGFLNTGDMIHIKGSSTDFTQTVESMEYEHQHIDTAAAGQSIGLRVKEPAREHDIVFLAQ